MNTVSQFVISLIFIFLYVVDNSTTPMHIFRNIFFCVVILLKSNFMRSGLKG